MRTPVIRSVVFAIALALALGFAVMPAAAVTGTVPNHAMLGTTDLYGMDEAAVRAAIAAQVAVPTLPDLQVTVAGAAFALAPSTVLSVDADAMVAAAWSTEAGTTFTVAPAFAVSSATVNAFAASIASAVYLPATNAKYYPKNGHLYWQPAVYGRKVNAQTAASVITAALLAEAASGTPGPVVALNAASVTPATTDAELGRGIIVDISKRRLWLYDHAKLVKTVRVAVGMRAYPTPIGTFKVIGKKANPSWRNPGGAWGKNMPAYIKPGPSNPLGVRALYINSPGIRIHGTSKSSSIGHAASHGCVRVANKEIVKLYPLVPVGTKVFIVK